MRFTKALGLALVFALGSTAAQAQMWLSIHFYGYGSQSLAHSNGQKVVTGLGNKLHMVWEDYGVIKYSQSTDGLTWFGPTVLACGSPGRLPAIAADPAGKLAVVWVDDPTTSLQYVYYDGATWSMPMTIVNDGDEPTIAARSGKVHLAWRPAAADSIQYANFTLTTPALITASETVDQAACGNDTYRLPSIALSLDPCNPPIPVIGYLFHTTNPCAVNSTIGPRVCKRDNTLGTWGMTWQDPRTHPTSTSVEPISLSVSSRFSARQIYVAYSDVQNGVARTKLGHGVGTTWTWDTPETIDAQERHIHVRANESNSSPVGTFRLAREYYESYATDYRDGVWATTAAPTWSTAWTGVSGPPATRPHAHWWKRCSGGWQTDLKLIAEEDLAVCIGCSGPSIGAEVDQVNPCPPSSPGPILSYPCKHHAVALATLFSPGGGAGVTVIDATNAGVIKSFTDKGAIITTDTGGRIDVTWGQGAKVVESSDSTLSITAPADSVRFSSSTVRFTVDKLGTFSGFDRAPGGEVCSVR
ncbi:MAG: hypothetical protein SF066_15885 [Thermoanaerobaculia bacterium]|nr:hypothetical protein [Thermoanaerobaculia bacterium]